MRRFAGLIVAAALALGQSGVRAQGPPANQLVFLESEGSGHNVPAVSADGRHIAFLSSLALDPADTTAEFDIYVRDRQLGTTTLVSLSSGGVAADQSSKHPAISDDGRFIAFFSAATNLVANDTNDVEDVFVRDRDADGNGIFDEPGTSTTTRVSVDSLGSQGNCVSARPSISGNGRFVAFDSCATNWIDIAGKTFPVQDVFVHDLATGATLWVSPPAASSGQPFNNHHSAYASISRDGRDVAFASQASTQSQDGFFGSSQIHVRDTCLGAAAGCVPATEWASAQALVPFESAAAFKPSISADGRFVTYESVSTALVPFDTNNASDIFVYDRQLQSTSRVNVSDAGDQATTTGLSTCAGSWQPRISASGRFVTFESCANNLVPDDTLTPFNFRDVFIHDRDADGNGLFDQPAGISTKLISRNPAGLPANSDSLEAAISGAGRAVVFGSYSSDITPNTASIGLYVWSAGNTDPVAIAGADVTVQADSDGRATVTLDGSESYDADHDQLGFTWSGPFGTLDGVAIAPSLAIGMHTVTLTVSDGRGGQSSDTVQVTVTPAPGADLSVVASANPADFELGAQLTIDVTVVNLGQVDATNVAITVPLPADVTFVQAVIPAACAGVTPGSSGTLTCQLGALPIGSVGTVSLVVKPTVAGTIVVPVSVEGDAVDPIPGNNLASATAVVRPGPVLLEVVETIQVADHSLPTPSTVVAITEAIAVSDASMPMPSALIFVAETIGVADVSAPATAIQVGVVESIAVADGSAPQPVATVSIVETIAVSDSTSPIPIVIDTAPPVLALPPNITAAATSAGGAIVTYAVTASDAVDGMVAPSCAPAAGSTFPIGLTTVTCSATDAHGNVATGTFRITVVVGVPLVIGTLSSSGRDASGRFFVDVTFTNFGNGQARQARVSAISFLTLGGAGAVSYDAIQSGRLPLAIGSLDVGASRTQRLFLTVPRTVTRFAMIETGDMRNIGGALLPLVSLQVVPAR